MKIPETGRGYLIVFLAVFAFQMSCANMVQVKIDVVDQRTALENQVLGSYREIGGDTLLLASVRSIDKDGKIKPAPPIAESRLRAMRAMQRSEFNRDDIDRLKSAGVFGEGKDGFLHMLNIGVLKNDEKQTAFAKSLLEEENADRKTLYQRITEINENFKQGDAEKVRTIMAGLNRDSARAGDMVQKDNGDWVKKEK